MHQDILQSHLNSGARLIKIKANLKPIEIRQTLLRELGLEPTMWQNQYELLTAIYQHLSSLHAAGRKIVLVVDDAHALSDESLETVSVLASLDVGGTKLLPIVLFGKPELDKHLNKPHLHHLKQYAMQPHRNTYIRKFVKKSLMAMAGLGVCALAVAAFTAS